MIFIDDFENDIDYTILCRGKSYYDDGRVVDFKINDGIVNAVVCGSYDYDVEIETDNTGNILSADCDCPYDFGEFCKHEVAVFYYIREYFRYDKSAKDEADLKSLLMKQAKETLADIICEELSQYKHKNKLKEKLIARFTEFSDSTEGCEKIIWKHLNASKVNGRIRVEDLDEALEGAYKVFDIAEKLESINYIEAAKRYFKIIDIITSIEVFFCEYYWDEREGYSWASGFYKEDEGVIIEGEHACFARKNILHDRIPCNSKDVVYIFKTGADKAAFHGNPVFVAAGNMGQHFNAHFPFYLCRNHNAVCTGAGKRRICNCDYIHPSFLQLEAG